MTTNIGVVIPSYKVCNHILQVIASIGPEVSRIYVVDDCCPDHSGDFVAAKCTDPRVALVRHEENQGVGGAVMSGYMAAFADDIEIIVKIDGDGQMDPVMISELVAPIVLGEADYTKGNRFFDLEQIHTMPKARVFGNAGLSFLTKISSGYWDIFDPTNGYTAIHRDVARHLPFNKISRRYFFETDMLFRLNTLRAVVVDVPMHARYGNEESNLKISKVVGEFFGKNMRNFFKRVFYNYYLRDMSLASFELPIGIACILFGLIYGIEHWIRAANAGTTASSGTVMLAAMPILLGVQLVLAFIGYDISSTPKRAVHSKLGRSALMKVRES
jgi:dolichol-phosphate mannosyltransferase